VLSQQQPPKKDPPADREVFRSPGSLVLSWAWLVIAVAVLIDLAVQGRNHAALVATAVVLAISGIVYACAWRPRIVADSGGVTVVNPLRDHRVPWGSVDKVDVVTAVRVHCEPAAAASSRRKVVHSWAVQAAPRASFKQARRTGLARARDRQPGGRYGSNGHAGPAFGRGLIFSGGHAAGPPPGAAGAGYGRLPEDAREALNRTSAEFAAGRLGERAEQARRAGAQPGEPVAAWAWLPIAAVVIPVLLVVLVVLV
jgi:Bacterial PH domain